MNDDVKSVSLGTMQIVEGLLSKREMIAAMAMQGLLSSIEDFRKGAMYHPEDVSDLSVKYADALLAEIAKGKAE